MTYFRAEPVLTAGHHIRTRKRSVNWSAVAVSRRLHLVSTSIENVIAALRCDLGDDPTSLEFHRPDQPAIFDEVWQENVGVRRFALDYDIRISPADEVHAAELRARLEAKP